MNLEKDRKIYAFLKKIRRRVTLHRVFDSLSIVLTAGISAGLVIALLMLVVPWYYGEIFLVSAVLLSAVLGVFLGIRKRPSLEKTALIVDSLGYQEKIVTAYELAGKEGLYVDAVKDEALAAIGAVRPSKDIPYKIKKLPVIAMVVLLACTIFVSGIDTGAKRKAEKKHEVAVLAREVKDVIKEAESALENDDTLSSDEKAAMQQELEDLRKQLADAEDYGDIKDYTDKTYLKLKEMGQGKSEDLAENLETLADKLAKAQSENLESMKAEALEALEKSKDGSDGDKEKASDKLSNYAEASGDKELSEAAKEYASSAKDSSDANKATASINNSSKNASASSRKTGEGQGDEENQGDSETQNSNDTKVADGQENSSGGTTEGQGGSGNTGNSGNTGSSGESGSTVGSGQAGSGDGSGTGNGNGQSAGNGSGGGMNKGSKEGQEVTNASKMEQVTIPEGELGDDENLTGSASGNDSSTYEKSSQSKTWAGNKVNYSDVSASYRDQAYNQVDSSDYPEDMKDKIKSYFDGFN